MSIAALVARFGRQHALQEIKWLKSAVQDNQHALEHLINRRLTGEPLQYILGTQPFGPLNLLVRPPVLIPRPETEHWAIQLAQLLSPTPAKPLSLLDLGTGSGCIPLLLCHLWPSGSLYAHGIDCSPDAVQLATDNAESVGIRLLSASTRRDGALTHNVFKPELASYLDPTVLNLLEPPYDVITANPPYIPRREYDDLPSEVKDYEDQRALLGGEDGLIFYHAIAKLVADGLLAEHGTLALEVGHDQAPRVQEILRAAAHMESIDVWLDPWGKQRTIIARRS
ncbi:hypothetical protein HGRIS_002551 [Hohenbuehelia grisea]|uniref:Release factor glutamine methyltransferase N-terminal domain-containing protein n=1 Tax=Hohenbuehelia grisea TaxID=104357 RepID=A0ABR3JKS7_9AGAR